MVESLKNELENLPGPEAFQVLNISELHCMNMMTHWILWTHVPNKTPTYKYENFCPIVHL